METQPIDAFMCVHTRDLGYLFETVLQSYLLNFTPGKRLVLVSNDPAHLTSAIERFELGDRVIITGDDQWLSKRELGLPGWFRQQIIKLRAYEFCETKQFCNIGADTILLRPITTGDLLDNGSPVLYYRSHMPPAMHWWYEFQRVHHDARILGVRPTRSLRYVDFINDLFCFDRDALERLNQYLVQRHGADAYYMLLNGLTTTPRDQKKFGEWTLYSIFVLDYLQQNVAVRDSEKGFLHQVHSARGLRVYRFDSKAVHFVGKSLDVPFIKRSIAARGLALGTKLGEANVVNHQLVNV